MTTDDLALLVYLIFNLVVLAGICYCLRNLLRAANWKRMWREEVPRAGRKAKAPPLDPAEVVEGHLTWLDITRGKFLRRNGQETADAAIILGGLDLAQHRAHVPGTPAPVIPAPMLKMYRDYFGRWAMYKMERFTGRITARLVDEPAGHIVYREFAQRVLSDWQLKEMLESIDKFAPEPTKFIHGAVE